MTEPQPRDFRTIGRGMLVIGVLGVVFASTMAIAHYVFGMPIYEGHTHHLVSPKSIAQFIALFLGAFGLCAILGWALIRAFRK
jgi:hypothetical protein